MRVDLSGALGAVLKSLNVAPVPGSDGSAFAAVFSRLNRPDMPAADPSTPDDPNVDAVAEMAADGEGDAAPPDADDAPAAKLGPAGDAPEVRPPQAPPPPATPAPWSGRDDGARQAFDPDGPPKADGDFGPLPPRQITNTPNLPEPQLAQADRAAPVTPHFGESERLPETTAAKPLPIDRPSHGEPGVWFSRAQRPTSDAVRAGPAAVTARPLRAETPVRAEPVPATWPQAQPPQGAQGAQEVLLPSNGVTAQPAGRDEMPQIAPRGTERQPITAATAPKTLGAPPVTEGRPLLPSQITPPAAVLPAGAKASGLATEPTEAGKTAGDTWAKAVFNGAVTTDAAGPQRARAEQVAAPRIAAPAQLTHPAAAAADALPPAPPPKAAKPEGPSPRADAAPVPQRASSRVAPAPVPDRSEPVRQSKALGSLPVPQSGPTAPSDTGAELRMAPRANSVAATTPAPSVQLDTAAAPMKAPNDVASLVAPATAKAPTQDAARIEPTQTPPRTAAVSSDPQVLIPSPDRPADAKAALGPKPADAPHPGRHPAPATSATEPRASSAAPITPRIAVQAAPPAAAAAERDSAFAEMAPERPRAGAFAGAATSKLTPTAQPEDLGADPPPKLAPVRSAPEQGSDERAAPPQTTAPAAAGAAPAQMTEAPVVEPPAAPVLAAAPVPTSDLPRTPTRLRAQPQTDVSTRRGSDTAALGATTPSVPRLAEMAPAPFTTNMAPGAEPAMAAAPDVAPIELGSIPSDRGAALRLPETAMPPAERQAAAVVQQLAPSMKVLPDGIAEVSLSPAELGRVRMAMRVDGDGIVVHVVAERPETLDLLQRHSGHLGQALRDAGFADVQYAFHQGGRQGQATPQQPAAAQVSDDAEVLQPPPPGVETDRLDLRL